MTPVEIQAFANPDTPRSYRVKLAAKRAVEIEARAAVPQLERAQNRALQLMEGPQRRKGSVRWRTMQRLQNFVIDEWLVQRLRLALEGKP